MKVEEEKTQRVFEPVGEKRRLLVFRRLDLFWQPAFEVLLDLAVIFPQVVVHGRVHLLLCFLKVAHRDYGCTLAEGKHPCFPAEGFEIRTDKTLGQTGKGCQQGLPLQDR